MIQNLKRKLQNNHGASMILVMSLLLFCVMVSSVIIAAASSGTSRNMRRVQQQQSYLAVCSATDLIVGELEDVKPFVVRKLDREYGCRDCVDLVNPASGEKIYWLDPTLIPNNMNKAYKIRIDSEHNPEQALPKVLPLDASADSFDKLLNRAASTVYGTSSPYEEEFTIYLEKVGSSEKDDRLPEVTCKLEMDEEYKVTIHVKAEGSDYAIRIETVPTIREAVSLHTSEEALRCTHTIYYKELVDGAFVDKEGELTITGETMATTTTISWSKPEVTKEVGVQ